MGESGESGSSWNMGGWKQTAAIGLGVGAGAFFVAPAALSLVGFTAAGITAGSFAAGMMSSAAVANGGGVAAGGVVATCQSMGVVGVGAAAAAKVGALGSLAVEAGRRLKSML